MHAGRRLQQSHPQTDIAEKSLHFTSHRLYPLADAWFIENGNVYFLFKSVEFFHKVEESGEKWVFVFTFTLFLI